MTTIKKVYSSTIEAQKRKITAYLPQKYYLLTINYAEQKQIPKSDVVKLAIKQFFDRMPQEYKNQLMK